MLKHIKISCLAVVFCLLITLLSATPSPRWDDPEGSLNNAFRSGYQPSVYETARADSAHGFDVQKYEITLSINQAAHTVSGFVTATVLATTNLSSISYNLESLNVSSVLVNGNNTGFTHTGGLINIPLNVNAGQTFSTTVHYSGSPVLSPNAYHIGMIFSGNTVFTISDPDAARYWWPCYDHPWDKAIVDLHITMRSDWKVAANGLRDSIVNNGDGTSTTHWIGQNPMTTYLVCVTSGPYVEIDQTAQNGSLPIKNFVMQSQYNNALSDLARLPQMIDFFSETFGPYPFEKYGNTVVSMSTYGAMEHQTMTTLGNYIINGNGSYEKVIAHELAHQWYGDAVSFLTFKDVWLSEGFATYSELLWTEETETPQAALNYLQNSFQQYYINWENSYGQAPRIYDPAFLNYFTPPSYEKAACVLHMLRYTLGEANFFQLLQNWFSTYDNGNVITSEFQAMAEAIQGPGTDLDYFFDQWIYGSGIPSLQYSVFQRSTDNRLKVIAKTTSPTTTPFTLDLPFQATNPYGSQTYKVRATPNTFINSFEGIPELQSVTANQGSTILLRGITETRPVITECLPSNGLVFLSWEAFNFGGNYQYHVYRKAGNGDWVRITGAPSAFLTCHDDEVTNGIQYSYMVKAVDSEGYESQGSLPVNATPIAFSFAQTLLLVDETRDGNGANIAPNDAMVDEFYTAALAPLIYDSWDAATQGLPPLSTLGQYRLVIWHADDFSQNLLGGHESVLSGYLMGGGAVILSGWKTASVLSPVFFQRFAEGTVPVYDNAACFISASSVDYNDLEDYADLMVDTAKLTPSWNNMLPMTYTFPGTVPLYIAQMSPGSNGNGLPVAYLYQTSGVIHLAMFGIPLYFMQPEGVRSMLEDLIDDILYPTAIDDEILPQPAFRLSVYPNPFNPTATIAFSLPRASKVEIDIFNLRGQRVRSWRHETASKGEHKLSFDGKDQSGKALASGIYTVRIKAAGRVLSKRISLIK
ncbi:MAG TPA: M1 family aminopeptidase [Candidatus Cloacimonadota bacterium]|nr:M1 family aminopeptidase [Candidatus Cloacimonadota bacterium]